MLRQAEYHPEAKSEMQKAASWYDNKVDGLGLDFLFEVKNAESYIVQNPELWPNYEAGTKQYIMQRFPSAVIYLTSKERIQLVAVENSENGVMKMGSSLLLTHIR